MGDFEDVFGAGTDAVDIIEGFSREYARSSWKEKGKENWDGSGNDSLKSAYHRTGNDSWSTAMAAKGYTKGPQFNSYDELSAWDSLNARSHIRSRTEQGYQIYFTDGQPHSGSKSTATPDSRNPTPSINDNIPF